MTTYIKHDDGEQYDFIGMIQDDLDSLKHTYRLMAPYCKDDAGLDVAEMFVRKAIDNAEHAVNVLTRKVEAGK